MHYFLFYKEVSELLFQKSNASYSIFPLIDWQPSCPPAQMKKVMISNEKLSNQVMHLVNFLGSNTIL